MDYLSGQTGVRLIAPPGMSGHDQPMTMPFIHKENQLTEETAANDYLKWLEEEDASAHDDNRNGWQAQESSFLQSSEPRYSHL